MGAQFNRFGGPHLLTTTTVIVEEQKDVEGIYQKIVELDKPLTWLGAITLGNDIHILQPAGLDDETRGNDQSQVATCSPNNHRTTENPSQTQLSN